MTRHEVLRRLGIGPRWVLRGEAGLAAPASVPAEHLPASPIAAAEPLPASLPQSAPAPTPANATAAAPSALAALDWAALEARAEACRACALGAGRQRLVFGVGDRRPRWLFVGEGPGAEEDLRGEPFVGQAGKLLDAMLAALGLLRGEGVYIANTVKCRPPHNRTPEGEEMAACWPFLERQIELLQPEVIVALGRPAAQALLGGDIKIGAARGQVHRYRGIPLVVTYHPAYLLRNLGDKAKAWEDLLFARRQLAR